MASGEMDRQADEQMQLNKRIGVSDDAFNTFLLGDQGRQARPACCVHGHRPDGID
jgi:hypothetical protein